MIHIVEFYRTGIEHLAFNTSAIKAIRSAYPAEAVRVYGEQCLLLALEQQLRDQSGIEFVTLNVASRNASKWRRIGRDFAVILQLKKVMDKDDKGLLLSVSAASTLAMLLLRFNLKILAFLHANLAVTLRRPKFNIAERWFRERCLIRFLPVSIKYCVLERGVASRAVELMPELTGKLAVIPHPVPEDVRSKPLVALEKPLKIGLCGLLTPQKGLMRMQRLAQTFQRKDVEFHLHGRLHQSVSVGGDYTCFATQPSVESIDRESFLDRISSLDLGAFFFTGQYYELTASGVLLDYMALGLPLFGYRNTAISAIESEFGVIGWFCNEGDEGQLLETLLCRDLTQEYSQRRVNLLAAAKSRTVSETGLTIKSLYSTL